MLILVGGSASGKSTIEKILCKDYGYEKITSYTTRSPREGEIDGVDYHYISEEDFKQKQENGFFAEVGVYNGWHYGSAVEDCTNDKVAVLTPHGMRQIKKMPNIDTVCIYIDVPRRDRLVKILQRKDNIEEAKRRDASDVGQFDGIEDEVDYIIKNEGYKSNPESMARHVDFMYKSISPSKKKISTILCDIDEVVNNLIEKILEKYNEKYNDSLTLNDITEYELAKFLKPECVNVFKEFCSDSFLFSLDVQPKAKEIVNELMENYNFFFVSSKYPSHVKITDEWLKHHFEKYDSSKLVICKNKSLVHGDILIDDCIANFQTSNNKESSVKYNVIYDRPWNRGTIEDNVKTFRVHGWSEIKRLIEKLEGVE